jgi:carbamate kinase
MACGCNPLEGRMSDFLVVAFGGNAIAPARTGGSLDEQRGNVRRMSGQLARLIIDGHHVVVTHGNGPQVGEIMLKSDLAREVVPPITLDLGGAMSQGQLGYLLQQEIGNVLASCGHPVPICSLVTQVVVDEADRAFDFPTKPIGRFYTKDEAEKLERDRGWRMVEDAGRGYRRVVPSPMPGSIVEWPAIRSLVEGGMLVIAAGGGGIPVVRERDGRLRGVEAVIDKDFASERLATLVGARTLALLTEVENVQVDFGTPKARPLGQVSAEELEAHLRNGQFPAGSMGPKVQAAIAFLRAGGERAIITAPERIADAVNDPSIGTQIMASAALPVHTSSTGVLPA